MFAYGKSLLLGQNYASLRALLVSPPRVKPIEIGDVERIEYQFARCREHQLFFVDLTREPLIKWRYDYDSAGSKRGDKIAIHGIFVEANPDTVHDT